MKWFASYAVFTCTLPFWCYSASSAVDYYRQALEVVKADKDYVQCSSLMENAVAGDPQNAEYHQLLGSCYMYSNLADSIDKSLYHLHSALELTGYASDMPHIMGNYIEALRIKGTLDEAMHMCNTKALQYTTSPVVLFNCAIIYHAQGQAGQVGGLLSKAVDIFLAVNRLNPYMQEAWLRVVGIAMKHPDIVRETSFSLYHYVYDALHIHPNSHALLHIAGTLEHKLENYEKAMELYIKSDKIQPSNYHNLANIGAIYQALGNAEAAALTYENLIVYHPRQHDAGLYNNYGSLMGIMMHKEEELFWLSKAYQLNPRMNNVNINLGGFYQDEGYRNLSRHFLSQAVESSENKYLLKLRMMLYVSPVAQSWTHVLRERVALERELVDFCSVDSTGGIKRQVLDSSLDRIHFHLVYHGLFDRDLQQLIVQCYHKYIHNIDTVYINSTLSEHTDNDVHVSKSLQAMNGDNGSGVVQRRMRIGFISKFFGVFEPHGQLLDGIMTHLPRDTFEVYAFPIPRTDLKPLSHSIARGVDKIVEIPLANSFAANIIAQCHLDALVFADTMSEPVSHFLAHIRLAPIQAAFWGNPVTSASLNIDYFVSADHMEHPFRTLIPSTQEPYTEQVVLIEGQGIWYYTPKSAHEELMLTNWSTYVDNEAAQAQVATTVNRTSLNLDQDWFIFLCPQSVFKMHPLFDTIFTEILYRIPKAHLLITEGRRPAWTQTYLERIYSNMRNKIASMYIQPSSEQGQLLIKEWTSRLHVKPRVSSEKFISLLEIANVVLHPFPFDGSKTSADAIWAGVPYITLPSEYLRGRMGMQYLRTMNIPALCAANMSHYIEIAVQLADQNLSLYKEVVAQIEDRKGLIYEDLEVPYQWSRFFTRLHPSYEERGEREKKESDNDGNGDRESWLQDQSYANFLRLNNKASGKEMRLLAERETNRALFDASYGKEEWLLDHDGSATLQGTRDVYIPVDKLTQQRTENCRDSLLIRNLRIFNDWKDFSNHCSDGSNGNGDNCHINSDRAMLESEMISKCIDQEGIDPVQVDSSGFAVLPTIDTPPRAQRLLDAIRQHLSKEASLTMIGSPLQITLLKADYEDSGHSDVDGSTLIDSNSYSLVEVMDRLDKEADVALAEDHLWYSSISVMRDCVLNADVLSALRIVTHLLAFYQSSLDNETYSHRYTSLFFTEAGCVFYFNGLYDNALHHCQSAADIDEHATLAHVCIGVSGLYTKDKQESLVAFQRAIVLRKEEEQGDISSRNVMKSTIFSAPRDAIEYNWITALSSFHYYSECTAGLEQILQLSLVKKGSDDDMVDGTGSLLFTLGFVDWEDQHWQHLSKAFTRNVSMPVNLSPSPTDKERQASKNSNGNDSARVVSIRALPSNQDVIATISTIQHQYQHLLTTGSYCLMHNEASKPVLFASYFYLAHLLDTIVIRRMMEWEEYILSALPLDVSISETSIISLTSTLLPFYGNVSSNREEKVKKEEKEEKEEKVASIHLLSQYFFPLSATHDATSSLFSNDKEQTKNHAARDIASALYLNVINRYIDVIHLFVDTSNLSQVAHLAWYGESENSNDGNGNEVSKMVKRHVLHYLDTNTAAGDDDNNRKREEQFFFALFQRKVAVSVSENRLRFKNAFAYANTHIPTNSKVIIANSDIYFDGSLERLSNDGIDPNKDNRNDGDGGLALDGRMMALSKWVERYSNDESHANNDVDGCQQQLTERLHTLEVMFGPAYPPASVTARYSQQYLHVCHQRQGIRDGYARSAVRLPRHIGINIRADSQDAWIFSLPLPESIIEQSNFPLGVTRCDNRLAAIFTENGIKVTNPALMGIRAIERMTAFRETSLYTWDGAVFGEVRNVLLSLDS